MVGVFHHNIVSIFLPFSMFNIAFSWFCDINETQLCAW